MATNPLINALRQHRLLNLEQLEELDSLRCPDAKTLAKELIQRDWITPYQANQLLNGRGQELVLGSYILLERLGEGGMGQVFKARHRSLGRIAAIKLIRKERLDNPNAVRRFQREVRSAAALAHPNIVLAYDADEIAGTHLMVMEYVEGAIDLAKVVKKHGPLPVDKACDYIRQAALGLQHAFERGLVHRDIKPANLLLTTDAKIVKVLDMGLARLDEPADDESGKNSSVTLEGAVMGTPDYMAPEQALDTHTVDIRADLYSLGCTFYYLLTGRVPFPGGTLLQKLTKHQFEKPLPVEQLRPEVTPEIAGIVRKLMARQPVDRYQTPADVAAALAAVSSVRNDIAVAAMANERPDVGRTFVSAGLDGSYDRQERPPHDRTEGQQAEAVNEAGRDTLASAFAYIENRDDTVVSGPPQFLQGKAANRRWLLVGGVGRLVALVGLAVILFAVFNGASDKKLPVKEKPLPVVVIPPSKKVDHAWLKQVAALPAKEQVKAVADKLKDLNRFFDGEVEGTIEDGVVTELTFSADKVTDISPVQALTGLRSLSCNGTGPNKGKLEDLWPLKGMKLTFLSCEDTQVFDLLPLKDMKLTTLKCSGTQVANLSPLKDMKLATLWCSGTQVANLSPLKDMMLADLQFSGTEVSDLAPLKDMQLKTLAFNQTKVVNLASLKDMKLTTLHFRHTKVPDLSPLEDMELTDLWCDNTQVSDLSPLRDMKLTLLSCDHARVCDLLPLQDMPLKQITCDFKPYRDADILRTITTLEKINGKEAKQLWKEVDAQFAAFDAWAKPVAAMPAKEQVKAVASELQKRNPDFDGKVTPVIDKTGVVTGLTFFTDNVTDIAPCALPGLRSLTIVGSGPEWWQKTGKLTDLSPLKGMELTYLNCNGAQISDLVPLRGMKLTHPDCWRTNVSDLSPLKGMMSLAVLHFRSSWASNLAPLKDLNLTNLDCSGTGVSDLSPLKDMKSLTVLQCSWSPLSKLPPLKDMKLTHLDCEHTQVSDLTPLKDGKVTYLNCNYTQVSDLTPLTGMNLTQLHCQETQVSDLAPLQGMKLTVLNCNWTRVADLTPLQDMLTLTELQCGAAAVRDLTPLKGLRLTTLNCSISRVSDLTPIKDMKLTRLWCNDTLVSDLTPLKDMKLTYLNLHHTKVSDLLPLKHMKLRDPLDCDGTPVSDLSPLKDMKLTGLGCANTKVIDLSPLHGMPLKELRCDFEAKRDTEVLHSIKTLEKINGKTKEAFWKEVATAPAFEAWLKTVPAAPAAQQVQAVADKLKERNPGFDGAIASHKIDNDGVVTELAFSTDKVADISPLRALVGLKVLRCSASAPNQGRLVDISPLKGLQLISLNCAGNKISDLGSLRGMPLNSLDLYNNTPIVDLSPLKGMPLTNLTCADTHVYDLTPLQDMKLTVLSCFSSAVCDLTPLQGMPLEELNCWNTPVSDLSALKGMPLKELHLDFKALRDAEFLRSIQTLKRINGKNVKQFWKEMDAK